MKTEELTKEFLTKHYVELEKTSRQISKEFSVSRKIVNKLLLDYNMISIKDIDPLVDLP